jgi:quinol monooxygenase YgiN
MIVEYIRYKVADDQREAFIKSYADASKHLDRSEFCLAYELTECEEEPGQFMLRIEWTSTVDHLNGFRKGSDFPPFFNYIKPYFNNIQEMRHYALTSVVKKAGK